LRFSKKPSPGRVKRLGSRERKLVAQDFPSVIVQKQPMS